MKKIKIYDWTHKSSQIEIVEFLNKNKTAIPVSVNNDDRGNWWLIYFVKITPKKEAIKAAANEL